MARGISNLLALLIVVSIVVGAGIAISVFLSGFMQKHVPYGGTIIVYDVELTSSGPRPDPKESFQPKHKLTLTIRGIYQGADSIEIKRVYAKYLYCEGNIYIIGSCYNVTVEFNILGTKRCSPNSYVKIYGTAGAYMPPVDKKIPITIEYCFGETKCFTEILLTKPKFEFTS